MVSESRHAAFIRSLDCAACGTNLGIQWAHVRKGIAYGSGRRGGLGCKPSADHTVPLCAACHGLQGNVGELRFWLGDEGLASVHTLAGELYRHSGNRELGLVILEDFRNEFRRKTYGTRT